ncbi:uncharacterized protein LOC142986005 [Anticarsia gemmatalis]|uniref:uncharacterized protein LOC142986005 n=1 Tax=Anticarsia gemmatalis TaxID=129554 RepID=UPI003F75AE72
MAKRSNPFIEDYVPQSKIHVSLKQFNNNEDRLQKVYEKTLELLFKGAKKTQLPDVVNSSEIENAMTNTDKKGKMKQLFLSKNGTLLHSGNIVHNQAGMKQCSCGGGSECQCAYCEVSLCYSCQHLCARCERAYCTTCTMIGLEGSEVCVSCYS